MGIDQNQLIRDYVPSELQSRKQWELLGQEMLYRGGVGLLTGVVLCTVFFRKRPFIRGSVFGLSAGTGIGIAVDSANQRFLAMQANANSEVDTTSSGEAPQER
eukprot:gb/GECG01002873.1/.p1 GENE.gb/GECG01002873.1/~~gb/GECG01002873.1/.p1  ORF type:complete len:103 (+),score=16.55 gb/GECG01002873.1/:1-309(+)